MNKPNPFLAGVPELDLHGEVEDIALYRLQEAILEAIMLGHDRIIVIHGIGAKILLKAVRTYAKNSPLVTKLELDLYNDGMSIFHLQREE